MGYFLIPQDLSQTETENDKKWVVWDCAQVITLTKTETTTNVNGFHTPFIGLCQCEHTLIVHEQYIRWEGSITAWMMLVPGWLRLLWRFNVFKVDVYRALGSFLHGFRRELFLGVFDVAPVFGFHMALPFLR